MNREEWGLILILVVVTTLSLAFAPPRGRDVVSEAAPAASAEVTANMPLPTSTDTPSPTATELPATSTPPIRPTETREMAPTPSPTATTSPSPVPMLTPTATPFPFDVRADLERYIYVDQATQHMFIFEWGKLLRDIPCSTGLPDDDKYTPAWSGQVGKYVGTFFAFDVYADQAWYLFMSQGAILVHSLPYTLRNGYKVYQDREALGNRPASHGCVRIAPEDADWFTAWNPQGVFMTISDPYLEKWRSVLSK